MSLGLVAYDDSEDSDTEIGSENDTTSNICVIPDKSVPVSFQVSTSSNKNSPAKKENESNTHVYLSDEESGNSSKLHIPDSRVSLLNTDIDIKSLTSAYQKNGPVKITIPSLNEIADEAEQPSKKKLKPSKKGSGLFALLPDPKTTLVPQSVTKKSQSSRNIKQSAPKTPKPEPKVQLKNTLINYDDSGDEESSATDFFSLDVKNSVISEEIAVDDSAMLEVNQPASVSSRTTHDDPKTNDDNCITIDDALHFSESFQPHPWQPSSSYLTSHSETQVPTSEYPTEEFMTFSNSDLALDKEAMQQLCGRRDRLKMNEVNLIDVRGDAIMPDSREWLTKQMTEEQAHRPSHKKRDGPTSQQKRKHQITYLAYQAKENELELKNQWANNRMSRKQTQAKYGF